MFPCPLNAIRSWVFLPLNTNWPKPLPIAIAFSKCRPRCSSSIPLADTTMSGGLYHFGWTSFWPYQPGCHGLGSSICSAKDPCPKIYARRPTTCIICVLCTVYIYICVCVQHILPTNFQFSSGSYSFQSHVTHGTPAESSPPHLRLCALVCNICCKICDGSERLRFIAEVGEEPLV